MCAASANFSIADITSGSSGAISNSSVRLLKSDSSSLISFSDFSSPDFFCKTARALSGLSHKSGAFTCSSNSEICCFNFSGSKKPPDGSDVVGNLCQKFISNNHNDIIISVNLPKSNECLPFLFGCVKITTTRGILMKHFLGVFGLIGAYLLGNAAYAISAGTVGASDQNRGSIIQTPTATSQLRGHAGVANAYKTNQRNTYFIVSQPDVDTACREKIFKCLTDYCGDVTVVPGQRESKCQYATETELYNYTMLCLQRDTEILLPQYGANTRNHTGGMNTAAQLCPSYVQQELISYMSMSSMANQLSKSNSNLCIQRRQELEAAMACHTVALTYGNETTSMLTSQLTDYCGAGVPGGSAEMVTRFANAGNVGANVWGWAEKIVSLNLNKKGDEWQAAVDSVLAGYTNRMNLACGDNLQLNTVSHPSNGSQPSALQTVAAIAVGAAFPTTESQAENPYENWSVWMQVESLSDEIYTYDRAFQLVQAALSNPSTTPNAFFTSAQIDDMQRAYIRGTKVFVVQDSGRCFLVPVAQLTDAEQSLVSQSFAHCIGK